MKRSTILLLPLLASTLYACGQDSAEPKANDQSPAVYADMIIHGGPIYTGAQTNPLVEAVAVKDGAISGLGAYAGLKEEIGETTQIIDLDGAAMYPGFVDAHAHLIGIGLRELTLNLDTISSVADLVTRIGAAVAQTPAGQTVYGRGWIETGWPEARMPNRIDLDAVSPDNPVILFRADGHAAVINSAALEAAGIDAQTADPDGGKIERDGDGRATGILIDNAISLVSSLIDTPDTDKKREAFGVASEVYTSLGWTGLHNMSVDPENVGIMTALSAGGSLALRVYNSVDQAGLGQLEENGAHISENGKIITRAIKLYVDGSLGSRGAALSAPYSDRPDTSGLLLLQKDDALALFDRALGAGIQVNTHAIGDRGNKLVLDWYEEAFRKQGNPQDARWRIEHAQIVHIEDIPRFASLGVIPSMQPSHAIGDLYFAPDRLGTDRLDGAYAWRALIDAGSIIAAGSDAPVERGDPRIEFYAAVARRGLDGTQTEDWHPDQAVTREEALKMFTLWPAIASFQEDTLGTIEIGKRADFTAFSKDIMRVAPEEILTAQPVLTVIDGDVVFGAE